MDIYTDGSSVPNPGKGGWGFLVVTHKGVIHYEQGFGGMHVTNNQMELQAAIEALKWLRPDHHANIHSDSTYLVKSMALWIPKRGYLKYANADLFGELLSLIKEKNLTLQWHWVKSHADNEYNIQADKLAVEGMLNGATCPHCKAVLSADTINFTEYYRNIICGTCGETI